MVLINPCIAELTAVLRAFSITRKILSFRTLNLPKNIFEKFKIAHILVNNGQRFTKDTPIRSDLKALYDRVIASFVNYERCN